MDMTEEATFEALQLTKTYDPDLEAYVWKNSGGQRHRLHGPAVECINGSKSWWVNGKLHRIDGPAVECINGSKSWYVNGRLLTREEFNKITECNSHRQNIPTPA